MNPRFLGQQLQYVVIAPKLGPGDPSIDLCNEAFRFWSGFWPDVLREVGAKDTLSADQFRRHDAFSLILHQNKIVGMHAYTFFNLALHGDRTHSFFEDTFTPKAMNAMDQMGAQYVMTKEYFAVAKEWQGKSKGVSMGVVLLSLSQHFFLESSADMWIGAGRADIGVAKLVYSMGGVPLDQGLSIHGCATDLIGVPRARNKFVGSDDDKALVKMLWDKRDIRCQLPGFESVRKAA